MPGCSVTKGDGIALHTKKKVNLDFGILAHISSKSQK